MLWFPTNIGEAGVLNQVSSSRRISKFCNLELIHSQRGIRSVRLTRIQVFESTLSRILAHYSTYYSTPNIGRIVILFRISKRGQVIRLSLVPNHYFEDLKCFPKEFKKRSWPIVYHLILVNNFLSNNAAISVVFVKKNIRMFIKALFAYRIFSVDM